MIVHSPSDARRKIAPFLLIGRLVLLSLYTVVWCFYWIFRKVFFFLFLDWGDYEERICSAIDKDRCVILSNGKEAHSRILSKVFIGKAQARVDLLCNRLSEDVWGADEVSSALKEALKHRSIHFRILTKEKINADENSFLKAAYSITESITESQSQSKVEYRCLPEDVSSSSFLSEDELCDFEHLIDATSSERRFLRQNNHILPNFFIVDRSHFRVEVNPKKREASVGIHHPVGAKWLENKFEKLWSMGLTTF